MMSLGSALLADIVDWDKLVAVMTVQVIMNAANNGSWQRI